MNNKKMFVSLLLVAGVFILSGCAAQHEMYMTEPAGFWAGLWHGMIVVVTFIISLFTDSVGIYEINNTGAWYNFGFVLGILIVSGCGSRCSDIGKKSKSEQEQEWEEIGVKVEEKVRKGIQKWLDETESTDAEWEEEWTRHHYKVALASVRKTVEPKSVEVFDRLVAGDSVKTVADQLEMTAQAVHKIKQRMRKRVQELIADQIREEDGLDEGRPPA